MVTKILYTGGAFDLFHYGHVNFLKQCSLLSDDVVVALNTDEFIERYKCRKTKPEFGCQEIQKFVDFFVRGFL